MSSAPPAPPLRTTSASPCWTRTPTGPWEAVRDDLTVHGVGLVQASLREWLTHRPAEERVRRILGRDLHRYEAIGSRPLRERFAASRTLLRCAVGAAVSTAPEHVEIGYHLSGRPFVRGCDQVDISLSHTEDVLLVGVTSLGRIGVDVESTARAAGVAELHRHVCTPAELAALAELPSGHYEAEVLRRWILKEAYSKALGQGLHFPFTEFGFSVDGERTLLCGRDGVPVADPTWSFRSFDVRTADSHHRAAVALQDLRGKDVGDTRADTAVDARTARALWADSRM